MDIFWNKTVSTNDQSHFTGFILACSYKDLMTFLLHLQLTVAVTITVTFTHNCRTLQLFLVGFTLSSNALLSHLRLERFLFECHKTKTKVITLTNHNSREQSYEPIRAQSKYMSPMPSAGKHVRVNHDWFCFLLLIGRGSGARFFNQSQSVAMQNQSNCRITFGTQLKSTL